MRFGAAAWLCCFAFAVPVAAAAPAERFFDYLYIEANSGSSAGGHAAVRFGNEVYHFQHADPGIIRPAVHSWTSFDLSYRGLGNRPIHIQRIGVSGESYDRLRAAFQRRYVVQESQLRLRESVARERELIECLEADRLSDEEAVCGVELPGSGYFFDSSQRRAEPDDRHAAPIAALRRDVERIYGDGFLKRSKREVRDRIARLRPASSAVELPRAGAFATFVPGFAEVYSDLLLEWLALRVLGGEAAPVSRAFRKLPETLAPQERRSLAARFEQQRRAIIELLSSTRSDRGYPLLVAVARLVGLDASLASDHLIVLDAYADDDAALESSWVEENRATLVQIRQDRRREMETARRAALAAAPDDEAAWSRFEVAANVERELEDALERGRPLRWRRPAPAPSRSTARRVQWPAPVLEPAAIRSAAQNASTAASRVDRRLRDLYRYDLLVRNCVTEIFRTIDEADGAESDLGGRVEVGVNATFIPFFSAGAVRDAYAVNQEYILPSYRQQGMERLRGVASLWVALLREETALTSTLVPFDPTDEVFLFFSEDSVVLRPLVGIANVIFGAAGMVGGSLALPFDGGALFTASARGVFYSFPEIAFINIRKGTVPLLPASWDAESRGAEALGGVIR